MLRWAWIGLTFVTSCFGGGSEKPAREDAAVPQVDAPPAGCASDAECAAADPSRPRCAPSGACVACLDHTDCADPSLPTCDPDASRCRPCLASRDCASGVCDSEDGVCVAEGDVYYVDDDASCAEGDGSAELPYCSIDDAMARFAMEARNYVHFRDGTYPPLRMIWTSPPTFSGAEEARLSPDADGRCASIDVPAAVSLRGFRFVDCPIAIASVGPARSTYVYLPVIEGGGVGIACEEGFCSATGAQVTGAEISMRCLGGATCELHDSTLRSQSMFGVMAAGSVTMLVDRVAVLDTGRKGIVAGGAFLTVRDSQVSHAGLASIEAGIECGGGSSCVIERTRIRSSSGAGIALLDPVGWRIESSAIVDNGTATDGAPVNGGVWISAPVGAGAFAHNTVYGNRAGAGETGGVRCGGSLTNLASSIVWANSGTQVEDCLASGSDIDQDGISGFGNFREDPAIARTAPGLVDEHLMPGSPCLDRADPATAPATDIDGQPRDAEPDVGADER